MVAIHKPLDVFSCIPGWLQNSMTENISLCMHLAASLDSNNRVMSTPKKSQILFVFPTLYMIYILYLKGILNQHWKGKPAALIFQESQEDQRIICRHVSASNRCFLVAFLVGSWPPMGAPIGGFSYRSYCCEQPPHISFVLAAGLRKKTGLRVYLNLLFTLSLGFA